MSLSIRLVLPLCLVLLLCAACSTAATPAPAAPAPVAPAATSAAPAGQTTSAPASGLMIPGAPTPEARPVRLRLSQDLAEAPKLINFPVWAPDPSVLGDGSAFAQIAIWEAQRSDSDVNNPVRVGAPLVEMIYRGANGYWIVYQGVGSLNDFKWRFPYFGKGYDEGTVRGQKAWFSTMEGSNEAALYWEEAGRVIVIGGRYSRPDYIKIAESMKPLK